MSPHAAVVPSDRDAHRQQAVPAAVSRVPAAETALLGALLCAAARGEHRPLLEELRQAGLRPDDLLGVGPVLGTIQRLDSRGITPDMVAVIEALGQTGELAAVGGAAVVSRLVDGLPDDRRVSEWARTLHRAALERRAPSLAAALNSDPEAAPALERLLEEWQSVGPGSSGLVVDSIEHFLSLAFQPREFLLEPILRRQDLGMVYGWRGDGKTWVTLGCSLAVASGGRFLRWAAKVPHSVLHVDGEMPATVLQERLAVLGLGGDPPLIPRAPLRIIAADRQASGIPSLDTPEGQRALEAHLDGVELLVLDNISTLVRGGVENEAESWLPMQSWLLSLRRRGLAVLFAHHAGKGGQQRGTSRREDVLDLVLGLRRPDDYTPGEGARFECHVEKARSLYGKAVDPFEARLETTPDRRAVWIMRDLEDRLLEKMIELTKDGLSTRDVAKEVGKNHSTVVRRLQDARARGLL